MDWEFPQGATWRACCVSCGETSRVFPNRAEAIRWGEQHRIATVDLPGDVVIECRFRAPGGTETLIFEQR